MADDADTTDTVNNTADGELGASTKDFADAAGDTDAGERDGSPRLRSSQSRLRMTRGRVAVAVGVLVLIGFSAAGAWEAFELKRDHDVNAQRERLVDTARQAAVNLTTVDSADIANDVSRILESSTGNFREEFQARSDAFTNVVAQAQSKSEGTVTAAGIETQTGDSAQVLVAINVQTTVEGSAQPDPRAWRMRITIVGADTDPKVADVQFVP